MRAACATLVLAACAPTVPAPARAEPSAFGLALRPLGEVQGIRRFEASEGSLALELALQADLPADRAARLAAERSRRYRSAWEPGRTGYPGQITETISCPAELLPTELRRPVPGGTLLAWQTWASPAGTAGVCAADLVAYALVHGWLACDGGLLVELDLRGPKEGPALLAAFLDRARCDELLLLAGAAP